MRDGIKREGVYISGYVMPYPEVFDKKTRTHVRGNGAKMFILMRPDGTSSATSNRAFLEGVQTEIGGDILPIIDEKGLPVRALTEAQQKNLGWLKETK